VGSAGGVELGRRDHGTHGICVTLPSVMGLDRKLGFIGCSSHSGRRSVHYASNSKSELVSGSLRDVQALARHASLSTTSRYIEMNSEGSKICEYPLIGEMAS
jgi:hypothetical protein